MKVLLDTNVLSELLRLNPESAVLTWFASQSVETLFVSAVTQAEMMLGARLLPNGKRRAALESAVGAMFNEDFSGRVLPFDSAAAFAYVDIVVTRRARGQPISQFDARSPRSRSIMPPGSRHATWATSKVAVSPW